MCKLPVLARGWCRAHYYRWKRTGDVRADEPLGQMRPRSLVTEAEVFAHFMGATPPDQNCWDWPSVTRNGYGVFSLANRLVAAHHASYRIYRGPITPGLFVLHSCDRPICVQPAHLSLGTPQKNMDERSERDRNPCGEDSSTAKLTADQVRWIRSQEGMSHKAIADAIGISRPTVTAIRNRRLWKHLPP